MNKNSSFMGHFTELNKRIILLIFSLGVAFVPGWILYDSIIDILLKPLISIGYNHESLVVHQITEPLQVKILVVFFLAFYISLPIIVFNIAAFLIPAAKTKYIKISWLLTLISLSFFYGGAYLGYINIHHGLEFLMSFTDLTVGIRSQFYFQFIFRFLVFIGIFFQFPIIVTILILNRVIKVSYLINRRKEIFILILFIAAIITPTGDPVSLLIFTLPVYIFYEILIFSLKNKFD